MLLPRILLPVLTLPMIKIRSSPAHMSSQSASVKNSSASANNSHGHISGARAPITHPHFPVKKHPQPKLFTVGSQSPYLSEKRPSQWTGGKVPVSSAADSCLLHTRVIPVTSNWYCSGHPARRLALMDRR